MKEQSIGSYDDGVSMQRVIISSLEVTDISSDRNELEFSVTLS